jgi:hypothetical protein
MIATMDAYVNVCRRMGVSCDALHGSHAAVTTPLFNGTSSPDVST